MGDPKGFIKTKRETAEYRSVCERIKDYKNVAVLRSEEKSKEQASRCMDCGTPFCHWGCPIGNYIPEWNDLVYHGHWKKAFELLEATNNMPEITGRVCPAPCEYGCTLDLNDEPVTIRENELAIIEYAFENGLVKPRPPRERTGKKVAVIGSGPAGLACAAQLNKAGHSVTVFERDDKIGGILRYGIPDFKLEKSVLDRRLKIFEEEGVDFRPKTEAGKSFDTKRLLKEFDAACIAIGSRVPRDLNIEGRDLKGIHFAMDYLIQANKRACGEKIPAGQTIDAKDKKVVVIGGGDTGSDCIGTAHRQGAKCVVEIEILPEPPECRCEKEPWPCYPMLLRTTTSHEEGGERHWLVTTKRFSGTKGKVGKVHCVKEEKPFEIEADLVILAIGFIRPGHKGLLKDLNAALDPRGNVRTDDDHMTSVKGVFCAGDARCGQSLIVRAISEGRKAARSIDKYLMGKSSLADM